jgi:phage terminase large subunit
MQTLKMECPRAFLPLLRSDARYLAAKGGRGGGKSHYYAEHLIRRAIQNPNLKAVCIREIQKSLRFSVKSLIEQKINRYGLGAYFDIKAAEIRLTKGSGIIIFQGMQDHTADSIKSLEDFDIAWVEEAQNLSDRSLTLLRPTIRKDGSQIWFSWNPEYDDDPVDVFFQKEADDSTLVHVNIDSNPFASDVLLKEMQRDRATQDLDRFAWIWQGEYKKNSKDQVLAANCEVREFEPGHDWDGPYYGGDWGFSEDPTAGVKLWMHDGAMWIEHESYEQHLTFENIAPQWKKDLPDIERHVVRADSSRPDTINYVKRHGIPQIIGCSKGKGSVEDGVEYLRSLSRIYIHPRCNWMQYEARKYRYSTNRAGDPLTKIEDANNHLWDSVRYAVEPLIKNRVNDFNFDTIVSTS